MSQDGQDALLFPVSDQAAFAVELRRLLGDDALRDNLARSAALSVRQRYGLPAILADWDALMARAGVAMPRGRA
jgi:glycosyltransferase involved in cell wall biosynthesis